MIDLEKPWEVRINLIGHQMDRVTLLSFDVSEWILKRK